MASKFTQLSLSLKDDLTQDECRQLCAFFNIPRARRKSIWKNESAGLALFDYLVESETISETDVGKLWEALMDLNLQATASKVKEYQTSMKEAQDGRRNIWTIPNDPKTAYNEGASSPRRVFSFADFLSQIELDGYFPQRLKLEQLVKIKYPPCNRSVCVYELFWQKLSSLDYRVRSSHFFKSVDNSFIKSCSIRDFIFALLHCADTFLRQDIIEKMSTCQLAVPLILGGTGDKKPELLLWSFRNVIKKWKTSNSVSLEQHIVNVNLFTVSFIRVGDIRGLSKSTMLNTLLGSFQGNDPHPLFLTRHEDPTEPTFSKGCVESVCYLPMMANGSEKFKWVSSFLNLRGNCVNFPVQTNFVCRASDLTIAFIAYKNREKFESILCDITEHSKNFLFVSIDDDQNTAPNNCPNTELTENILYVRSTDLEGVVDHLSSKIIKTHKTGVTYKTIEDLKSLCETNISVEENNQEVKDAFHLAEKITSKVSTTNLVDYKKKTFPLQEKWADWVALDRKTFTIEFQEGEKSVEIFRDQICKQKEEKRKEQLQIGLSDNMKEFRDILYQMHPTKASLGYFLSYLQNNLFRLVDQATKKHLEQIEQFEEKIKKIDEALKPRTGKIDNLSDADMRSQLKRKQLKRLLREERDKCSEKNIGWEHFLRELGQLYEAYTDLNEEMTKETMLLPDVAASLLVNGESLEIMDGDTGRVPLTWITSVLDALTQNLEDPKIFTLCVAGAQSSGKSTLLNSMFGVKFPVRAGRCTRGLFLRMLEVDEDNVSGLGFKYLFLIDSEGTFSIERTASEEYRFDNELITLALCISDVTILNIEGENIGPETTGLLQIAAHAFMRMKEVDLQAQCRIIQQRVSDLTARERNKLSMSLIIDTLDKATVEAAREEGYSNRYHQFSDVFNVRLDENSQFIPCLWGGSMSPPCQFYSDIVFKVKESILDDIASNQVSTQFSISTFTQRIHDVWLAIKEENFIFNFQDSVKAVDFNTMCMEVNKLVIKMRLVMKEKLEGWRQQLKESTGSSGQLLDKLHVECKKDLQAQRSEIVSSIESYVSKHKREENLRKHLERIVSNVKFTITSTEKHLMRVLKREVEAKEIQDNVPYIVSNMKVKLREEAKRAAQSLQGQFNMSNTQTQRTPEETFEIKWGEWKEELKTQFNPKKVSEIDLVSYCENLLLSIAEETATFKDITQLATEGGLLSHADPFDLEKYFSSKGVDNSSEDWIKENKHILDKVIVDSSNDIGEEDNPTSFDANLFQCIIQNAFQMLSCPNVTCEPPGMFKAKFLLHLAGRLLKTVLQQRNLYDLEHSFEKLFEAEKMQLLKVFLSYLKKENQIGQALECFRRHTVEWVSGILVNDLKHQCSVLMQTTNMSNPLYRNLQIVNELCQKQDISDCLSYCKSYFEYQTNWLMNSMANIFKKRRQGKTMLQENADMKIDIVASDLRQLTRVLMLQVEQLEGTSTCEGNFKQWIDLLIPELIRRRFPKCHELASELYMYVVSDPRQLTHEIEQLLLSGWKNDVRQASGIENGSDDAVAKFVKTTLKEPVHNYLQVECKEQCPLCRSPCDNVLPPGPYHTHFSCAHLPRGISGAKNLRTSRLIIDECTTCVSSKTATYLYPGDKKPRPCKDYKKDFPSWNIQPDSTATECSFYWKLIMAKFNEEFARHYKCKPAIIPNSWNTRPANIRVPVIVPRLR